MSSPDPVTPPTEQQPKLLYSPTTPVVGPRPTVLPPKPGDTSAVPTRIRRRTVPVAIGIAVALVMVAGGVAFAMFRPGAPDPLSAAASPSRSRTTPPPSRSPSPRPSPTPSFTPFTGDLHDLLMPVPAGGSAIDLAALFAPGMSDAERAAAIWNEAEPEWMLGLLEDYDFVRGTERAWARGADRVLLVLLQFERPVDASRWSDRASGEGFQGPGRSGRQPIPGVEGGWWITIRFDNNTSQLAAVFYRSQFAVILRAGNNSSTPNLGLLEDVALQQYELLPE